MPPTAHVMQQFETAKRLVNSGRAEEAIEVCLRLIRKLGSDPALACVLSSALVSVGRAEDARRALKKPASANPQSLDLAILLADACRMCRRVDEAHRHADRAITLAPESPRAIGTKAMLCLATGETEAAAALLAPMAKADAPEGSIALFYARLAPEHVTADEAIAALERAVHAIQASTPTDAATDSQIGELYMRLGQLHETAERFDRAFGLFEKGNALGPGFFDPAVFSQSVTAAIARWTPKAIKSAAASRVSTERPVFIVGMPRSGTTLIERILGAHRAVMDGGERSDVIRLVTQLTAGTAPRGAPPICVNPTSLAQPDLDKTAVAALDSFGRLPRTVTRTTDKMPLNGLHLGVISRLFPGARIIYCTRDARDTCLSCYANWLHSYHAFSRNLAHVGSFHRDFDRLMKHWQSVLNLPILEVAYEDVVADLESQARKAVDFLGLEWDDACLNYRQAGGAILTNSADQVRRPVYSSSVGRWKRFESHLSPLLAALNSEASPSADEMS